MIFLYPHDLIPRDTREKILFLYRHPKNLTTTKSYCIKVHIFKKGGINMTLLKVLNKKRNITYVYESKSEWDSEKKQSRSTRKLVGKIDPKTGEIVPTGTRGRKKSRRKKNATTPEKKPNYKSLYLEAKADIKEQDDMIVELKTRVADLEIELRSQRGIMAQIRELASK